MFNEGQKQRFIEYASGKYSAENVINIASLFNKTEPYETRLDKDVSCFNREDISNMYSMFRYSSIFVYSSVNSKLNAYTEWCASQLLIPDGCNHFKEFTISDFDNYVNERIQRNRYLSKEEFDVFVEKTVNLREQFLLMCLWEFGKSENYAEIFQMKLEDIDKEKQTVKLVTGREVSVSKRLIEIAEQADAETVYYQGVEGNTKRKFAPSEYIYKRVITSQKILDPSALTALNNKLVARTMKNIVDQCGVNKGVNAGTIAMSGQIDMIGRRSRELGITKEEYVLKHFDEIRKQYNPIPNNPKSYLKKNGAYL